MHVARGVRAGRRAQHFPQSGLHVEQVIGGIRADGLLHALAEAEANKNRFTNTFINEAVYNSINFVTGIFLFQRLFMLLELP